MIRVEATASAEIRAAGARVNVRVSGAAGWFDKPAERRNAEVRELVAALAAIGIPESHTSLKGATQAGVSTATYELLVRVTDLTLLEPTLQVLATRKTAVVHGVSWWFDEDTPRVELARAAVASARVRAEALAEGLGMRVVRIVSVLDRAGAGGHTTHEGYAPQAGRGGDGAGLTVIGTRTLLHTVTVEVEAAVTEPPTSPPHG